MAVLGSKFINLAETYKRSEDGKVAATIIEMLAQTNPILDDAIAVPCNQGLNHRHTIRTGLPDVAWGKLYKGTPQSKSATQQVDDTTGFLEAMSSVDERLIKIADAANGTGSALRLQEASAFLEAMNQEMAATLFYGDTATTPEKFKGLAARFGTIATSGAGNQIIDAGGTGSDNTSIWMVTWGVNTCGLLYPQGMKGGIDRMDMGRQRVLDADGNPYFVLEEKFSWHLGCYVKDWRYVVRIANIDVSELQAGNVDLYKWLRKAYYKLQNRRQVPGNNTDPGRNIAIYCNRDILEALDAQQVNARGGTTDNFVRLVPTQVEGKEVMSYRGMPIRECDALLNTEARVV